MGFQPAADIESVINSNFTAGNVTGISSAPTRKYPTDRDLQTTAIRQTNGYIRFDTIELISAEEENADYDKEEWEYQGFIYLDDGITHTEFLDELQRCLNVNNQSSTRTAAYKLKWHYLGFISTLMHISFRISARKTGVAVSV